MHYEILAADPQAPLAVLGIETPSPFFVHHFDPAVCHYGYLEGSHGLGHTEDHLPDQGDDADDHNGEHTGQHPSSPSHYTHVENPAGSDVTNAAHS